MAKKRKQPQQGAVAPLPVVEAEPPRKRTLLGLVPASNGTTAPEEKPGSDTPVVFRNKEKTLVLCSRRITFRCVSRLLLLKLILVV